MNNKAKQLYEKMIDFKRFASILLDVGVFFYLGVIIPSAANSIEDVRIMMIASTAFIALSVWLFIQSRQCRSKLLEMDEGEEYLLKK